MGQYSIRGPIQDYFSNAHTDHLIVIGGQYPTPSSASNINIVTSSTTTTWSNVTKTTTLEITSLAYDPNGRRWVALTETNATYPTDTLTSSDGINWTAADNNIVLSSGATDNNLIWNETDSVFAMHSGRFSAYSSTGTSWTAGGLMPLTAPYDENSRVKDIIWVAAQSKYVCVGFASSTTASRISSWTSTNLVSWTQVEGAVGYRLDAVAWSPSLSLYTAVGQNSTGEETFMSSTNGTAWTLRFTVDLNISNSDTSVIWQPDLGMYVATVAGTRASTAWSYIYTSTNGTSWTQRLEVSSEFISQVRWDDYDKRFIAIGDNAHVSTDGISWTYVTTPLYHAWDIAVRT